MDIETKHQRNTCLDLIKGVACIFVVFMHCEFPGVFGIFVQSIARFCVPFFFMVSGYYCYRGDGDVDYGKKLRHIVWFTLAASLFYLGITHFYTNGGVSSTLSIPGLRNWVLFNVPVYIAGQLWFLYALLYDYILFWLVQRFRLYKLAFLLIPVGIVVYIAMAQGAYLCGISVPNQFYRNFLFEGFPLFALGYWIHSHQDDIRISNRILLIGVLVFTLLCPVERFLLGRDFGVNIVSFPQVIALFVFCIKNPGLGQKSVLTTLGAKYSMYVYVIHPAVWHLLEKLYAHLSWNGSLAAGYLMPVLCVLLTLLLSVLFVTIKTRLSSRLRRRTAT